MTNPTMWAGLFTLIILEIILGIDNLIFIAILANKLPQNQQKTARVIGLGFALILRIAMLASISWIVTLTDPCIHILGKALSGRDLILLTGGVFLLFKATMELHERLEGYHNEDHKINGHASFWNIVVQIIVIDAVFSIDSVITAVGMVSELSVMITSVVISVILMLIASTPLTNFINRHPTLIILCLGFLLMIGFSLVIEGLGYHVPKGYVYAAIAFSVLVELFNQCSMSKRRKTLTKARIRAKTAAVIHRLLGGKINLNNEDLIAIAGVKTEAIAFNADERNMIGGILSLAELSTKSIMTTCDKLYTISIQADIKTIKAKLLDSPFSKIIVVQEMDAEPIGIIDKKSILNSLLSNNEISISSVLKQQVLTVKENTSVLDMLNAFKKAKTSIAFVTNTAGNFVGIVTITDIIETIAGDFPE
ncbi:TerC family protein [Candidatus Trichorickettsia mobilis]|uniref:TerC family protein n=1 Tax=Candidatus Trichorickettsia mobilis TaxID=1346319 RepID=UPI00292F7135|nr:CBS domain-containing protein [Candidatus Trichorickettsia mobilis]